MRMREHVADGSAVDDVRVRAVDLASQLELTTLVACLVDRQNDDDHDE